MISEEAARATAAEEAAQAYRDLSIYTVTATAEDGNWRIDYDLTDEMSLGGGPHFVIDGETGEIIGRWYEQ